MLTVVAALAHGRQVFVSPPDQREEARAAKAGLTNSSTAAGKSDHIAIIAAFNIWHGALKAGGRREALQVSSHRACAGSIGLDWRPQKRPHLPGWQLNHDIA